jgi:voltage-gated potassium channel
LLLATLILIHTGGMMVLEALSFGDSLWLSITTVTTVGYGDYSAATWQGRILTTVFLYFFAIALLAQLAAEFFDYRTLIRNRKLKGLWRWKDMNDHLLIINTPNENTEQYLFKLIEQIRLTPEFETLPIQILTRKFENGLPDAIANKGVVHHRGVAENNDNLQAVNVSAAKYIIIIARDATDAISDSLTYDVLSRIREIGTNATIAVEVAQDINRQRMKKLDANVIIRPIRAYPELLVRSLVATGTEEVLENLFIHEGDHMVRLDFHFEKKIWSDIVCRFVTAGLGIPMAFINDDGVQVNPLPNAVCSGNSIISLIKSTQNVTVQDAQKCLA